MQVFQTLDSPITVPYLVGLVSIPILTLKAETIHDAGFCIEKGYYKPKVDLSHAYMLILVQSSN